MGVLVKIFGKVWSLYVMMMCVLNIVNEVFLI